MAVALEKGLHPDDRFNLIQFNSDSQLLFEQSVPADAVGKAAAKDFIDALTADGGTNMAPALREAMSLPLQSGLLRQIVFVTDGSVGNEEDLLLQFGNLNSKGLFARAGIAQLGFERSDTRAEHGRLGRVVVRSTTLT